MTTLTIKRGHKSRTVTIKVPGAGKQFETRQVCSTGRILADVDKRGRVLSVEFIDINDIKVKQ